MRTVLARTPGFAARVFSTGERAPPRRRHDPAARLASSFAVKEAVVKSLGHRHLRRDVARHRAARRASGRSDTELVVGGPAGSVAADAGVVGWSHRVDADRSPRRGGGGAASLNRRSARGSSRRDGPDRGARHLPDPVRRASGGGSSPSALVSRRIRRSLSALQRRTDRNDAVLRAFRRRVNGPLRGRAVSAPRSRSAASSRDRGPCGSRAGRAPAGVGRGSRRRAAATGRGG